MKKLLLLGGSMYLIPAIEAAHSLGVRVITCDYLPGNIAHKYSDEYRNVSIVDKEKVLALAKELSIDGIMSYATDPGVECAAWVAEQLGLPTSPYESVAILQNKRKFRNFLKEHGFNVPWSESFSRKEDVLAAADGFSYPVMVKPTDSAGSKGVSKVDSEAELSAALDAAFAHSLEKAVILEQVIEPEGHPSGSESFSVDGKLVFCSFDNQWFDCAAGNPWVPAAQSWPSSLRPRVCLTLRAELQRLLTLLHMGTTIYNVEARLGTDGKPYLMEVAPRAGGNRLAELLKLATGQDLILASVKAALGLPVGTLTDPVYNGHWCQLVLHADRAGHFKKLWVSEKIRSFIYETKLTVAEGDPVEDFMGANATIGSLILHCGTAEEMDEILRQPRGYVRVEVEA